MAGPVPDLLFRIRAQGDTARAFQTTKREAKETSAAFAGVARQAQLARNILAGFAGGFAFGALNELTSLPRVFGDVTREARRLVDTADKVGLTVEQLQELNFAAEQSGVAAGTAEMAFQRFSRRVAEAAAGTGVLKPVLEANNVALRSADGRLRSNRDLLGDYANLIKNATSEQDKLRLAFLAFDSEGAALVNTMRDGRNGLDQMAQSARDLGMVFGEDLSREAAEINKNWDNWIGGMETRFKKFTLEVVTGVAKIKAAASDTGGGVRGWLFDTFGPAAMLTPLGQALTTGDFLAGNLKAPTTLHPDRFSGTFDISNALARPTIIPHTSTGSGSGAANASREAKLIADELQRGTEIARFFGETTAEAFGLISSRINTGNQFLDHFLSKLIEAGEQALLLGQGPLAGLFAGILGGRGAGGGLLGPIFAAGGSFVIEDEPNV